MNLKRTITTTEYLIKLKNAPWVGAFLHWLVKNTAFNEFLPF